MGGPAILEELEAKVQLSSFEPLPPGICSPG